MPKKSPNNPKIPKLSIINPKKDLFMRIKMIPKQKQKVPLNLFGLLKNEIVRCGPIINTSPITKRMLPNARNAESKNANMPNMKKKNPPAVKPTPNSKKEVSTAYSSTNLPSPAISRTLSLR